MKLFSRRNATSTVPLVALALLVFPACGHYKSGNPVGMHYQKELADGQHSRLDVKLKYGEPDYALTDVNTIAYRWNEVSSIGVSNPLESKNVLSLNREHEALYQRYYLFCAQYNGEGVVTRAEQLSLNPGKKDPWENAEAVIREWAAGSGDSARNGSTPIYGESKLQR